MKIGYSKTCGASSETEDLFSFENSHGQIYFHFRKVQQTMQSPLRLFIRKYHCQGYAERDGLGQIRSAIESAQLSIRVATTFTLSLAGMAH